jgi:hypothetical protein
VKEAKVQHQSAGKGTAEKRKRMDRKINGLAQVVVGDPYEKSSKVVAKGAGQWPATRQTARAANNRKARKTMSPAIRC